MTTTQTTTNVRTIDVDRIDPDPAQPRKHFDPDKLAELGESMRQLGQLQSLTVRYVRETRRYVLVAGERRWRAAQQVGITALHAVVLHIDEADALPRSVAENVARAAMTPTEEAQAFQRMLDAGYDLAKVASTAGKSADYVSTRLRLLGLVGTVAEAVDKGHLPLGVAWYLAKLDGDAQRTILGKWMHGEFPSARDAEAYARTYLDAQRQRDEQSSMFQVPELDAEHKERIVAERRKVTAKIDRLAAAGEILAELAELDPQDLALMLAGKPGGVDAYRMRVEHVKASASKASANLRRAAAAAAVRNRQISM